VQGSGIWSPPTGTLGRIVHETEARVEALRRRATELGEAARAAQPPRHSLARALRRDNVAVIAEVKRKSPSKGVINAGLSAVDQARAYAAGGAAAISVLTEPNNFNGSVDDLAAVAAAIDIPALKKDFHIDPLQLAEARANGATAALLIVRALRPELLADMLSTARSLALETIVEIRDEEELRLALECGAPIIGINNRDLETLVIDPATSERLLPLIPPSVIAIAESGMSSRADVERVAALGADAVLVGSSVSASPNPTETVRELASVARVPRG
jgi:indole-3-glycerol phosphate synthase